MKKPLFCALLSSLAFSSCATLQDEPWARTGAGTHTLTATTGWAFYEAEVELTAPDGSSGKDVSDLTPNYGAGAKYQYFLTDAYCLGLMYERRSFEADPIRPLSATLHPGDFETDHFILVNRYFFDPVGDSRRWRPFLGLDLGYVPGVDMDVTAAWSDLGPFADETQAAAASSYWTLGIAGGLSYLLADNLSLEFGGFYETALNKSEDTIVYENVPGPSSTVPFDAEIHSRGWITFLSLTWYL